MVCRGDHPAETHLAADVVDGLLQQLEALTARGAGLHGAGQVQLLQELLQLLVRREVLAVGWHQQPVH